MIDAKAYGLSEDFFRMKFGGKDNHGKPKQVYLAQIAALDDRKLRDECQQKIWLSAYAANNSRSDYHWQADACYQECNRRDKLLIYDSAYRIVEKSVR